MTLAHPNLWKACCARFPWERGPHPGPNGPVKLEHPSPPLRVKVMTCHSTLSTLAIFKLFESQNGEDFKVEGIAA
jgi:hypothetical protein